MGLSFVRVNLLSRLRSKLDKEADAPSLNDIQSSDYSQEENAGFRYWWYGNAQDSPDWDFDEPHNATVTAYGSNLNIILDDPIGAIRLFLKKNRLENEDIPILGAAFEAAQVGFGFTEPVTGVYKTLALHRLLSKPDAMAAMAVLLLTELYERYGENKKGLIDSPLEGKRTSSQMDPYVVGLLNGLRLPGKLFRRNVFRLIVNNPPAQAQALVSLFAKADAELAVKRLLNEREGVFSVLRKRFAFAGFSKAELMLFSFTADVFWEDAVSLIPEPDSYFIGFGNELLNLLTVLF